jgi:ADP-ribosylglycohydrolase
VAASLAAVRGSALWAAWGDALGFVTELAWTEETVRSRAGVSRVVEPVAWTAQVGGRFGAEVELPAGTYSDDTQLRLAVGRCIRSGGRFNVEAFSKIELPVFRAYALGAGSGTRAAATNLTRKDVGWSSNFYATDRGRYVDGGGNGAAMRIQPHVWADPDDFLDAVIADAVCTHGHMRAVIGATLHASCLAAVLRDGEIPRADPSLLDDAERTHSALRALGPDWTRSWEAQSGCPLDRAFDDAIAEGRAMLDRAARAEDYVSLARDIGALDRRTRGSGMVSAVLAVALARMYAERHLDGLVLAANLLESDTDTIASMAGALLGAVHTDEPPTAPADAGYIAAEAERLWRVSTGEDVEQFPHPDPWTPPGAIVDTVRIADGRVELAGLGPLDPLGPPHPGAQDAVWQWMRLWFGQDVLVKHRVPW